MGAAASLSDEKAKPLDASDLADLTQRREGDAEVFQN